MTIKYHSREGIHMRSTISFESFIGGVRVNSTTRSKAVTQRTFQSKASEKTRELAEYIPYWPQTIRLHQLMEVTGLSKTSITSRISACHGDFLIFSDRGKLSRLKPDLSNCN